MRWQTPQGSVSASYRSLGPKLSGDRCIDVICFLICHRAQAGGLAILHQPILRSPPHPSLTRAAAYLQQYFCNKTAPKRPIRGTSVCRSRLGHGEPRLGKTPRKMFAAPAPYRSGHALSRGKFAAPRSRPGRKVGVSAHSGNRRFCNSSPAGQAPTCVPHPADPADPAGVAEVPGRASDRTHTHLRKLVDTES